MLALGGAAAWPLPARAQAMPTVGVLNSESPDVTRERMHAFHQGLGEAGYVEGRNVAIEYRWAEGQNDRLSAMAADLIDRQVTVLASLGIPAAAVAKAATPAIPVVFLTGLDPIEVGLVASLNRPGGNLTGVTTLNAGLLPKRLELLHEVVPAATVIGLLVNPTSPNAEPQSRDLQAAARALGLEIHVLHATAENDLDAAFANLRQSRAGALVIGADGFFIRHSKQLGALTARHEVPAVFQLGEFAAGGGLMSYGASLTDAYHRVGVYVGRILKGDKPADLPVQQATKVELVINLRTAKALGLSISLPLLGRADAVIE